MSNTYIRRPAFENPLQDPFPVFSNSTATWQTFAPPVTCDTAPPDLKHYRVISRTEFEAELTQLVAEGRLSDFQEVEPEQSWNRWQGERVQRKYLAHVPDIRGYLLIKSGIDPATDESNGCRLHSIRLFFRREGETLAKSQTNRLPRWKTNFRKALERVINDVHPLAKYLAPDYYPSEAHAETGLTHAEIADAVNR